MLTIPDFFEALDLRNENIAYTLFNELIICAEVTTGASSRTRGLIVGAPSRAHAPCSRTVPVAAKPSWPPDLPLCAATVRAIPRVLGTNNAHQADPADPQLRPRVSGTPQLFPELPTASMARELIGEEVPSSERLLFGINLQFYLPFFQEPGSSLAPLVF